MSTINEAEFLNKILITFKNRRNPNYSYYRNNSDAECVKEILTKTWNNLDSGFLENHDCLSFLDSDNFKYYFTGVMIVSIKENNPYLTAIDNAISTLDRPNNISNWDELFTFHWTNFTNSEYCLIQEWLFVINTMQGGHNEDSIFRAIETLELLIEHNTQNNNFKNL